MTRLRALVPHPVRTLWLVALWLALWGTVAPANVLSGVLVAMLVQRLPDPYHPEGTGVAFRPLPALGYVAYMAFKMVHASLMVASQVVSRRDRLNTGVVEVPLRGASEQVVTIVANSIGLTPGSITVEVQRQPPVLWVHALHVASVDAVRDEVHRLEERAVKAFGTPEALEGLTPDDAVVVPDEAADAHARATGRPADDEGERP